MDQPAEPVTASTTDRPAGPASANDRVPVLAWLTAAAFAATELALSGRYGFQQDELYFIAAAHHLAFGYVDQPRLVPLLTRVTGLLGVSPTTVRIIPALAGGAVVVMAARLAALFGAGRFGRVFAALATACAPILLGTHRHLHRVLRRGRGARRAGRGGSSAARAVRPQRLLNVGPGHASDRIVLAVDALGMLRPYFASCRLLATYHAPDQVQNDWTDIQIAVCTHPAASWPALWPHLRHYG
jgi:hypothetical protein